MMIGFLKTVKGALPESVVTVLRRGVHRFRNRAFKPYLKKKNIEGVAFDFWIGDRDGREWYDLQCGDPVWHEMRFIKDHMIEKDDVILECGGHHGCTAIVLSNWVGENGKVITFEPLPNNCDIIEKNVVQNRLRNVTIERKAVGAANGKVTINNASNSSVALSGKGVQVEVSCLDDYDYLNPTFLKIDVEGFELQVLQGAKSILSKRPKLAIEIHTEQLSQYGASVEEIFNLIGVENYEFWIQWEDGKLPEKYDIKTPIDQRVHIFGIPAR
jgi:FkbM family methyltransferase